MRLGVCFLDEREPRIRVIFASSEIQGGAALLQVLAQLVDVVESGAHFRV